MEWGRLYANLADDPRVQRAERDAGAGWLLVESMCYCTSAETGGFIPDTQIERFSGGGKKPKKIAALVREQIWLPVEGGYTLNPDLWTEERNLSDQAEKKREADRKRIAAKRAAAKAAQNGYESRDSSATCRATPAATESATCSGDSRTPEKRREEISTADVVSHLPLRNARTDDDDFAQQVIVAVLDRTRVLITESRAREVITEILGRASEPVRNPRRFVLASVAAEPDPRSLLPPQPARTSFASRPHWCGDPCCNRETRRREDPETGKDAGPCPKCSTALTVVEAS